MQASTSIPAMSNLRTCVEECWQMLGSNRVYPEKFKSFDVDVRPRSSLAGSKLSGKLLLELCKSSERGHRERGKMKSGETGRNGREPRETERLFTHSVSIVFPWLSVSFSVPTPCIHLHAPSRMLHNWNGWNSQSQRSLWGAGLAWRTRNIFCLINMNFNYVH